MCLRTWRRLGRPRPPLVPAKPGQQGPERKGAAWSPGPQPSGVGTAQPQPPSAPQRRRTLGCPGHRGEAEGGQRQTGGGAQGRLTQDPGSSLAQPQLGGKMGCRQRGAGSGTQEGAGRSRGRPAQGARAVSADGHVPALGTVPTRPPPPGPAAQELPVAWRSVSLRPCPPTLRVTPVPAAPPLPGLQGTPWGGGWRRKHPRRCPLDRARQGTGSRSPHPPPRVSSHLRGQHRSCGAERAVRAARWPGPAQSPIILGPFPPARSHAAPGVGRAAGASPRPSPQRHCSTGNPSALGGQGQPTGGRGWLGGGRGSRQGQGRDIPFRSPASWSGQGRGAGTTEPVPRTGMMSCGPARGAAGECLPRG